LNFEFLLVLNHDEDWGLPKGRGSEKKGGIFRQRVLGRVKGTIGTWSRKPQVLF
jgi:hypothetical protein